MTPDGYCCPYHRRMARTAHRFPLWQPTSEQVQAERTRLDAVQARWRERVRADIAAAQARADDRGLAYSEDIPAHKGWFVYRLWAADGSCLYVGRVGDRGPRLLRARLGEHRKRKPWWPDVARIDAADCGPSGSAAEEVDQIHALTPVHNIIGNPNGGRG